MTQPYWQGDGITLYLGDCREVLPGLGGVDAVVTDPPYGLGFMGVAWDTYGGEKGRNPARGSFDHAGGNHHPVNAADQARTRRVEGQRYQAWCEAWAAECFRVLKPGGYLLAFGGTRTYHRLACAIEDAGFEVRDSLHWLYGSGFPKSKACLKPGHEPIVLARKPSRGMVPLNIDACRVGADTGRGDRYNGKAPGGSSDGYRLENRTEPWTVPAGRWPPNVLLTHSAECNGDCAPGCPVAELDTQSGTLTSGGRTWADGEQDDGAWRRLEGRTDIPTRSAYSRAPDSGGASRFFPVFRY